MSLKLRDLIRQVRSCKTAAEERAVIAKESAMIRTAIREEQEHYRHRNVAKLLFMHMLGYPTHFGQLECMKLIASPRFPEKRIGYLGMLILLSEETDVLMLSTNSLKNDLTSENKFVAGLALCTIGNLATTDMSRDLIPEIDKHLKSQHPYLRKKACLAMARCLVKCPDLVEDFAERMVAMLNDRSHGVLITVVQLMTQVLLLEQQQAASNNDEEEEENENVVLQAFSRLVPTLVKLLRNLLSSGYAPDHEVGGISDPFLQVQILTLLRFLGKNDSNASDEMNDVLSQVATNTESSKNAGNAILYECVQTIMAVESDDALRVLAVNILGRFLLNRDNNIRYVALNTLSRCVSSDDSDSGSASTLQRHRSTVVDCLKDPDISIRQRALELIYHLVNQDNVVSLTEELLNYLVLCPREHQSKICIRVLKVVDKFSPDDRWRIDTLITMLTIAGRECDRGIQNSTIIYISRSSEELRKYAVHKLLKALRDDDGSQLGLLVVGIWCIGEYGDLLLQESSYNSGEVTVSFVALEPSTIVKTVEDICKRHNCPESVHVAALTCYAKLSERFSNNDNIKPKLQSLLQASQTSYELERQLRSCEYGALVASAVTTKSEALARMPVVDLDLFLRNKTFHNNNDGGGNANTPFVVTNGNAKKVSKPVSAPAAEPNLLDLDDIFGGAGAGDGVSPAPQLAVAPTPTDSAPTSDVDLLADIFSAPVPTPAPPVDVFAPTPTQPLPFQPQTQPQRMVNDLFGDTPTTTAAPTTLPAFDTPVTAPPPPPPPPPPSKPTTVTVPAFTHQGLVVEFVCRKLADNNNDNKKSELVIHFHNTNTAPIYGLNLQCAVPKYVQMNMEPPTSTTLAASSKDVTQTVRVTNTLLGQKNLMLKVKLSFTLNGTTIQHMATCGGFPPGEY